MREQATILSKFPRIIHSFDGIRIEVKSIFFLNF